MGVGVLLAVGYSCFVAPVWQYPVLLVAGESCEEDAEYCTAVGLLGAAGSQVPDPSLEIWNDQIDDPDAQLGLAQKTRKAVVSVLRGACSGLVLRCFYPSCRQSLGISRVLWSGCEWCSRGEIDS